MDQQRRPVFYISRKRRRCYLLIVGALLLSLALGIACLVDEDWYTQGTHSLKWHGSVLRVTSGEGVKEGRYSSLHHHYCNDDSGEWKGLCNQFRKLALLGNDVIGFTIATLLAGLLQLLFVYLGWRRNHHKFLRVTRIIFGTARIGYGLAAPIEVFTKGHATMTDSCKQIPDRADHEDVCAGSGVYLLLVAYGAAVLSTVLIHVVFLYDIKLIKQLEALRRKDKQHQFISANDVEYSTYHFADSQRRD